MSPRPGAQRGRVRRAGAPTVGPARLAEETRQRFRTALSAFLADGLHEDLYPEPAVVRPVTGGFNSPAEAFD